MSFLKIFSFREKGNKLALSYHARKRVVLQRIAGRRGNYYIEIAEAEFSAVEDVGDRVMENVGSKHFFYAETFEIFYRSENAVV